MIELSALYGIERIVIAGGPRTGKTTIGARASQCYGHELRFADSLVGKLEWSEASAEVSTWFDDRGRWIVEGVSTVRALRKWLERNPGARLDATVLWLAEPVHAVSKGQETMAKGVLTVFEEIRPELEARRIPIITG